MADSEKRSEGWDTGISAIMCSAAGRNSSPSI